jgi:hypothetical protein
MRTLKKGQSFKKAPWTTGDIRRLKEDAGRMPISWIARGLDRSEAAVRTKAVLLRVSLARR